MGVHTGDSITVAPAHDAHRPRVPAPAQRGAGDHHRDRRRHGRLQHPVLRQPRRRPGDRHRDEPARLAFERAGLESHGLSDRQDRGQARRRLPARRASERHHRDERRVRAHHRLRRHQDPSLRLREVRRRRPAPDDADEVGRRGDGDRPHVQGVAPEGGAVLGDGPGRADLASRARRLPRPGRAGAALIETGEPSRPQADAGGFARRHPTSSGIDPRPHSDATGRAAWYIADGLRVGLSVEASTGPPRSTSGSSSRCARSSPSSRASSASAGEPLTESVLRKAKALGFSDGQIAALRGEARRTVRAQRTALGVEPVYSRVDTCAAEFPALTPYMYSTWGLKARREPATTRRR